MKSFTDNPFQYKRFHTREVSIGNLPLGGNNPIRIQSMTNTDTMDTEATVLQCIRMKEQGCEYVRIATPGIKEAENLEKIKNTIIQKGYNIPLIADIHFNPKAAVVAAGIVEKVRINPGNYIDRNTGKTIFSEVEYNEETEKVKQRLAPLINICKKNGTAIRIGTNHGSLSNRIVSRYGDTPKGMVESAMEFIRILNNFDFHNLVLSMKSSNVKIMIASTRLLVATMRLEGYNYPIHLGVTEAGDAEDGRIKSSCGIGALLEDGIGDTIRVSLTEDPEFEIPVAKKIVSFYLKNDFAKPTNLTVEFPVNPYTYQRRLTHQIHTIGNKQQVIIVGDNNADYSKVQDDFLLFNQTREIIHYKEYDNIKVFNSLKKSENKLLVTAFKDNSVKSERNFFDYLIKSQNTTPVIVKRYYEIKDYETFQLKVAADFGALLVDGFCDGIWIENPYFNIKLLTSTSYAILQAMGIRISKTEFIACPSCGRTQFKIQDTLKQIKEKTSHLKGLKIAVMGCIVNGPGEMADADYGYVGAGKGKITLYKQKEIIEKNIPENNALEKLIEIIKANDDWK